MVCQVFPFLSHGLISPVIKTAVNQKEVNEIFLKAVFPVLLVKNLQHRIFLKVFQEILNSLSYSREFKLVNTIKASLICFHVFPIKSFCHNSLINSSSLLFPLFLFSYHCLLVTLIHKSTFSLGYLLAPCLIYVGKKAECSRLR